MKSLSRTISLILALVLMSMLSIPAGAVGAPFSTDIAGFQQISKADAGRYPAYTSTLQRFLCCYSTDYKYQLSTSNGRPVDPVDGYFGEKTSTITISYQEAKGLVNSQGRGDGIVGRQTWTAIAGDLEIENGASSTMRILLENNQKVLLVWIGSNNSNSYYYYNENAVAEGVVS